MKQALRWIVALVVLGFLIAQAIGVYVFNSKGTGVAYQTSDGDWADGDLLFKGRNFNGIVFGYDLCKITCYVSNIKMQ